LFDYYDNQQKGLKVEVGQQKSLLNQRDDLAGKYEAKKSLLGDQLHLGESKSSYYADQLAATLPSSLQLTKLVLFPSIKEDGYNSEESLPRYDNQTILVEGQCQASIFYNNWKRSLEELNWVASIHNLSYQNNKNGQGIFKLKITLKNE
jgi:Tfp pilus assembly protein PilN